MPVFGVPLATTSLGTACVPQDGGVGSARRVSPGPQQAALPLHGPADLTAIPSPQPARLAGSETDVPSAASVPQATLVTT